MKKRLTGLVLVAVACAALFLTGCKEEKNMTGKVEENPLSEEEIIAAVKEYMRQQYNDEVEVEITGKQNLSHTTYIGPGIDGPSLFNRRYVRIKGGNEYQLEITNKAYGITVIGRYRDGFSLRNTETGTVENKEREIFVDEWYPVMKGKIDAVAEFEKMLPSCCDKFHVYQDVSNVDHGVGLFNIYLYGTDDEKMFETFKRMVEYSYEHRSCVFAFRAFIFTDEALYDSIDFDACNNIPYVDIGGGENKEDHPELLTSLELTYDPQKLIERYLGCTMTYIGNCVDMDHEFFVTRGVSYLQKLEEEGKWHNENLSYEAIAAFDQVLYIFEGNPQRYENSLRRSSKKLEYGNLHAYGFNLNRE